MPSSRIAYATALGTAHVGDSLDLMATLAPGSINLVMTSPPFALARPKAYGNAPQAEYVDWLLQFFAKVKPAMAPGGSVVIDLGGAYQKGTPIRSLHQFEFLLRMCKEQGWKLAEEFFWHNPARLPSPIEWVNKRKIRAKDSVNTLWWLSLDDFPQADITKVLVPYSERMKTLIRDPAKFYDPKGRPSEHNIGTGFGTDNGGAIPSNLLQISNTESNSAYLRHCKEAQVEAHPARFPSKLPEFFIRMLTRPGDMVFDMFAGSNTTGQAAEAEGRRWVSCDLDPDYVAASGFRFVPDVPGPRSREWATKLAESAHGRGPAVRFGVPSQARLPDATAEVASP